MDLSNNNFSRSIPGCFGHIGFGDFKTEHNVYIPMLDSYSESNPSIYTGYLIKYLFFSSELPDKVDEVKFVTKNRYSSHIVDKNICSEFRYFYRKVDKYSNL